jgi:hypothetical protein
MQIKVMFLPLAVLMVPPQISGVVKTGTHCAVLICFLVTLQSYILFVVLSV